MSSANILEDVLAQLERAPVTLVMDASTASVDANFVLHHLIGTSCTTGRCMLSFPIACCSYLTEPFDIQLAGQDAIFLVSSGNAARHKAALKRMVSLGCYVYTVAPQELCSHRTHIIPMHLFSQGLASLLTSAALSILDTWDPRWMADTAATATTSGVVATAAQAQLQSSTTISSTLSSRSLLSYIEELLKSSPGPLKPLLIVVEDVPSLTECAGSVAACGALCDALAALATGAGSTNPSPAHPRRAVRVVFRAVSACDWRNDDAGGGIGAGTGSGSGSGSRIACAPSIFSPSLLQGLTLKAHAVLHLMPLPSGYSRDVHGRIVLARRAQDPIGTGARGASQGSQAQAQGVCSLLYRVGGTDGKAKAVGSVIYHDSEQAALQGVTSSGSSSSVDKSVRFAPTANQSGSGSSGSSGGTGISKAANAQGVQVTKASEANWGADSSDEEGPSALDPEGEWVEGEES